MSALEPGPEFLTVRREKVQEVQDFITLRIDSSSGLESLNGVGCEAKVAGDYKKNSKGSYWVAELALELDRVGRQLVVLHTSERFTYAHCTQGSPGNTGCPPSTFVESASSCPVNFELSVGLSDGLHAGKTYSEIEPRTGTEAHVASEVSLGTCYRQLRAVRALSKLPLAQSARAAREVILLGGVEARARTTFLRLRTLAFTSLQFSPPGTPIPRPSSPPQTIRFHQKNRFPYRSRVLPIIQM